MVDGGGVERPVASRPREARVRTGSHHRGGEWTGCLADPQLGPGVTSLAPADDLDPVVVRVAHEAEARAALAHRVRREPGRPAPSLPRVARPLAGGGAPP